MLDEKECIICLIDTSANDYLELDCCKKIVHIDCLNTWIKTNIKNTEEIRKCFHCKKKNDYIDTIIHYTKLEEGDNTDYDLDTNSLVEIQDSISTININIRRTRFYMSLCNYLCCISSAIISLILFNAMYNKIL